jgi:hypothetical protein
METDTNPGPTTIKTPLLASEMAGIVLASFDLIQAFFMASTPASNSDFWLHLATGKALVEGSYEFGKEPFTLSENGYWTNPSWLYDVLLFLSYQAFGGTWLVMLKAVVVVLMAALLLATGRGGKSLFMSAFAVAVALLILGPWFSLKPVCLSFLFLAWTIWVLEKRTAASDPSATLISYWPLLAVFALWANLDCWFFLGPLIVGVYYLSSVLAGKTRQGPGSRNLGWIFLASLGVCFLNPHHFRIFLIPVQMEFSGVNSLLREDPYLRRMFISPFGDYYFTASNLLNPTGLAYWAFAILGLLSCCMRIWPWRWNLTWACFFLWSLRQTQVIPFFAIVSAPILARSLAKFRTFAEVERSSTTTWTLMARALAFAVLLAAAVAAWPGWLQIGPNGPRAWRVENDQTMRHLGERISRWQEQGHIPGITRAFNFSPETANHLAWICPTLKCFINSHLQLSPQGAADYLAVRNGLSGGKETPWRSVLHQHQIGLLVVHGKDLEPTLTVMKTLYPAFKECPLLAQRGSGAVFGWRDPQRPPTPDPFAALQLNFKLKSFAFREQTVSRFTDTEPVPSKWWDAFWRTRLGPSLDRDEAIVLLNLFDSVREPQQRKNHLLAHYFGCADRAGSAMTVGPALLNCSVHVGLTQNLMGVVLRNQDEGPVELLYQALRACRRALKSTPNDGQAYYLLGETYARLGLNTRERGWGSMLHNIRTCQFLSAFHQAVRLRPSNWQAHDRLAEIFNSMRYKDLTLRHLREQYEARAADAHEKKSIGHLEKMIKSLSSEVQILEDRYLVNAENLRVVDRAELAGRLGLAGKALTILLKSDISAFGTKGLELELTLLLNTGEVHLVKKWLNPEEHMDLLGAGKFYWISAQMEAGLGNDQEAERALEKMVEYFGPGKRSIQSRSLLALLVGNTLLHEAAGGSFRKFPVPYGAHLPGHASLPAEISFCLGLMDREAKALVLQGFLALETGANKKAAACFRRSLLFWNSPAGMPFKDTISWSGYNMASYFVSLLERANPVVQEP